MRKHGEVSDRKTKPQSPTGPPVRGAAPAGISLMDFQRHCLIGQGKTGCPTIPTDLTPEAPKRDDKHPHDDDEITEVLDGDKPAEPPKKKKKNKDPKEAVPTRKGEGDGAGPSTSMNEPEDVADEATPIPASTEVPVEGTKAPKKKKQRKEDAKLEKFQLEQREAKTKEMSKDKHRKLQREQDFRALRNYRKSIPSALLETINGADHSGYLLKQIPEGRQLHEQEVRSQAEPHDSRASPHPYCQIC